MGVQKGEGDSVLEEVEDAVSNLVDGQVLSNVGLGGFPHEGSFSGVELDQQVAVAIWRSKGVAVGDRFVKPGGDRVNFGGRGDGPEGCPALTVFNQEGERRQTGFNSEDWNGS